MKTFLGGVLAIGLAAAPAFADSSAGAWSDLSDRFQVDTGYFHIGAEDILRFETASTGSITGAVGGYASGWPTKRLALRADLLYIKVSPGDSDASVTDGRVGGDYYFFRNAGLGVQYKFNKYRYDRGILVSKLGGEVKYQGFQIFLSFLF